MEMWLGTAGDYTSEAVPLDHYVTKVGGRPVLPGSRPPSGAESVPCKVCGAQLVSVVQAYAPTGTTSERVLLLYGCVSPGCGRLPGAWRAFRCQLPSQPAGRPSIQSAASDQVSSQPVGTSHQPVPSPDANAVGDIGYGDASGFGDDGGFGAADWGMEDDSGAHGATGAFGFADLDAALEEASQAAAKTAAKLHAHGHGKLHDSHPARDAAVATPSCVPCTSSHMLPEFYVQAELEPEGGAKGMSKAELAHVQELLKQYEQGEQEGGASGSAAGSGAAGTALPADAGGDGAMSEESFAPEEYEEDEVRGVESTYLKFSERLQRKPEQCVRYSRGGPLLWPKAQHPVPEPCSSCGGACGFEMQLMAPAISLVLEAREYVASKAEGNVPEDAPHGACLADAAALNGAANWDICTVAVFTCAHSCIPATQGSGAAASGTAGTVGGAVAAWIEEQVVLVNEDDCHVPMQEPE